MDPSQRELGIKKRDGKSVEVKGLVEVRSRLSAPFVGHVQVWTKWTSEALKIDHLPRVTVRKRRWLRKFDTGDTTVRESALDEGERLRDAAQPLAEHGCHVELVALTTDVSTVEWWTFGAEAFGALAEVERSVRRTLADLAPLDLSAFARAREMSYPDWLAAIMQDPNKKGGK